MTLLVTSKIFNSRSVSSFFSYIVCIGLVGISASTYAEDEEYKGEWSSLIGFELTGYPEESDNSDLTSNVSTFMSAEYYYEWNDGFDSFTFSPRLRLDQNDTNRNTFDISELSWIHVEDSWELRTGVRQIAWGLALAQSPNDIINQTNLAEGFSSNNSKLGQPMINLSLVRDWGILDFYVLAGFREQIFFGTEARPGLPIGIDEDATTFPFEDRFFQGVDYAVRWQHSWESVEWAVSYFDGTSRSPSLNFNFDLSSPGIAAAYYPVRQVGLEFLYILDGWIFTLEGAVVDGQFQRDIEVDTYISSVAGIESSFGGLFGTNIDLILNASFYYDQRQNDIGTFLEHDLIVSFIFPFNDEYDSRVILAVISDVTDDENIISLIAERRLTDSWKVGITAVYFDVEQLDVPQDIRDAQTAEFIEELISDFDFFGESDLRRIIDSFGSILAENNFVIQSDPVQNAVNSIAELQEFAFQQPSNKLGLLESESSITIQFTHFF
ncbi:MAG: hypothetical protein COB04_06180 [Gammaproteobacteria bacterium]|nr:MAG: hypothetical protein COB04_06180 [Gammaproteobacteria bacterium]